MLSTLAHGLQDAFLMAWQVWWALVLGFAISAIVQAWVPRERIERTLGGSGARPVALATALGAASSSCSYAAVAIAKSLFQKGASAATALAFQFASTNLVIELGVVMWILIGWQFTLAEFVGGLLLVTIMTLLLRVFVSRRLEESARRHAQTADAGHVHHTASASVPLRARLTSVSAWSDVAHNFRGDWSMLYREILIGFLLAGFIGQLGNDFFNALFISKAPAALKLVENALVGPLIAVLSFVCSVGNVPLAAVLWSGGIGFAGVIAFIFADLIVLPIVAIYRKYYGRSFALAIVALMAVTMVTAALIVDGLFGLLGIIPHAHPTRAEVFGHVRVGFDLFANVLAGIAFVSLFGLTAVRGATDPVCGMKVDRARALRRELDGRTFYFCGEHCASAFEAQAHDHGPTAALGYAPASDMNEAQPPFHLFLDSDETSVLTSALKLLISDEAHQPHIRQLAREVLAHLDGPADEHGRLTVPLEPEQMKITHTAVHLLLDDLQREQAQERQILRRILDKLPDEHTMRAIEIE